MRLVIALYCIVPWSLCAQVTDVKQAAPIISAAQMAHHVRVLTHDSMLVRDTSNSGLELTARYVAEQFRQAGLVPSALSKKFITRYDVPLRFDTDRSRLVFATREKNVIVKFTTDAYLERRGMSGAHTPIGVVAATGLFDSMAVAHFKNVYRDMLRGKVLMYIGPTRTDSSRYRDSINALWRLGQSLVIANDGDSAAFARHWREAHEASFINRDIRWSAQVLTNGVPGLEEIFTAAGVSWAQARADTTPRLVELPSLEMTFEPLLLEPITDTTAPNVVGMLEGHDSVLKHQIVLLVAHMGHIGIRSRQSGRNANAIDNAFDMAGLIELAKAMGQPGARPRRTVVFAATSSAKPYKPGEAVFWGAGFVSIKGMQLNETLCVLGNCAPVAVTIALDKIGRKTNAILVAGLADVELPTPIPWIAASHPELQVSLANGGTIFDTNAQSIVFARTARPSLRFSTETPSALAVTDSAAMNDPDQAARLVRFMLYATHEIANASSSPRWTPEGRQRMRSLLFEKRTPD